MRENLGLIEVLLVFGLLMAWCVWQLLSLRRLRREREAEREAGDGISQDKSG